MNNSTRRLSRGVGNRRLSNSTNSLRASIEQYNLTNSEMALYNSLNTNVANQGLSPNHLLRKIHAANVPNPTKRKLAHHFLRQYGPMLSSNVIGSTLRNLRNKKQRKTRRSRKN